MIRCLRSEPRCWDVCSVSGRRLAIWPPLGREHPLCGVGVLARILFMVPRCLLNMFINSVVLLSRLAILLRGFLVFGLRAWLSKMALRAFDPLFWRLQMRVQRSLACVRYWTRHQVVQRWCGDTSCPPGGSWYPARVTWARIGHLGINGLEEGVWYCRVGGLGAKGWSQKSYVAGQS